MVSVCIGPGAELVADEAWLDVWLAAVVLASVEIASEFAADDRVLVTAEPEAERVADAALDDDTTAASRL